MSNNVSKISNPSILIIRLTSIGDVLLTTPLIRIMRNLYPDSRIDFLTTSQMKSVFEHNPRIDNILTVERKASLGELREENRRLADNCKYDFVIDLQNNFKSRILRNGLADKILIYDKRRLYKLKLVYLKRIPEHYDLIPDLYISTAEELGVKPDGKGAEFWLESDIDTGFYADDNKKFEKEGNNEVVIAPGAYHFTKRWPKENYISLIKLLLASGNSVSIVGGDEDIHLGEEFVKIFNDKIQNHIGKLSLSQTAEVINNAAVVVTNDTAVMHIAAARATPAVALFGSTVKQFGFTPYNAVHKIIEKDIACRPCTHYGKSKCPQKHFNCMKLITPEEVHTEVTIIKNLVG